MKFVYEYRTPDNVPHRGTIAASTKESAYDTLKAQGIKPGKVWEAPGFFNKLFGKGKRWILIIVLLMALGVAIGIVSGLKKQIESATKELEDITLYEERGQIYGAPSVLEDMQANDFASVFGDDVISRFLAAYAIPAREVGELTVSFPLNASRKELTALVSVDDSDLDEVKRLKRMVNRMKAELGRYIDAGGTAESYARRLEIRQKAEQGIYARTRRELILEKDSTVWREKNAMLRAKGLPMVDRPGEEK